MNFMKCLLAISCISMLIACERHNGKLLDEKKIEYQGITILAQLYETAGYGDERNLVYWCKSKKTTSLQTIKEFSRSYTKINENGWLYFSNDYASKINSLTSQANINSYEKHINIINENFLFINHSMMLSMTFDQCATVVSMPSYKFYSEMSDNKDQLFKKNELKLLSHVKLRDGLTEIFVTSHTHQVIKGNDQYCFNINQVWITDPNNHYQVCTADKGANWFTTRKIGDGKLMKRLAGSEEWVNHE